MLSAYPALFIKEEPGYSVIFPDLNFLASCGETLDEALAMAVDCLAGYLYMAKEEKKELPTASEAFQINPEDIAKELDMELGETFVNMVTVDVDEYAKKHFEKAVKKTLYSRMAE